MTFRTSNGFTVTVDADDYDEVMCHVWKARKPPSSRTYYVERGEYDSQRKKWKLVLLHRQLLDSPDGVMVDHWNGNGLDNRRKNLRHCTNAQNQANQQLRLDSRTGFRGVDFHAPSQFFRAHIKLDGKKRYLGQFATARDAAIAYDNAARSLYGEFARPNFPDIQEEPTPTTRRKRKSRGVIHTKSGVFYVRFKIDGKVRQFGTYHDEHTAGLAAQAKRDELGLAS